MAFPDLAVNATYTVLCLVPGYLSLRTVTYVTDLDPELTEFEKSAWSLVASGVSLSVTYFLYVAWANVATGRFVLVRSLEVAWVDLVAVYPLILLVAVAVGFVGGKLFFRGARAPTLTPPDTEG